MKKLFICLLMTMNMRAMQELALLQAQLLSLTASTALQDDFDEKQVKAYIDEVDLHYNELRKKSYDTKFPTTLQEIATLVNGAQGATKVTVSSKIREQVKRLLITGFFEIYQEQAAEEALNLCLCHSLAVRTFLIMVLVHDVMRTYPHKEQELVYTSLGSGGLLHDYLTVKELIEAGYQKFVINIIDIGYPDITEMPATYQARRSLMKRLLPQAKNNAEARAEFFGLRHIIHIEEFHYKVGKLLCAKNDISIHLYNNPWGYIDRVRAGSSKKSDILVMIDPGQSPLGASLQNSRYYMSFANMLELEQMLIVVPRHAPVQIYSQYEWRQLSSNSQNIVQGIREQGARPLRWASILELIPVGYSMQFFSSPHLIFQDLVYEVAHAGTVAYIAYEKIDASYHGSVVWKKIDRAQYEKEDVIKDIIEPYVKIMEKKDKRLW